MTPITLAERSATYYYFIQFFSSTVAFFLLRLFISSRNPSSRHVIHIYNPFSYHSHYFPPSPTQTKNFQLQQVIKCSPSSGSKTRLKPPLPIGKPRVLCVTVQRRVGSRGFKATLHICKGEPGQYEVRKSFRLRMLSKLEAFQPPVATQPVFEITVVQRAFTGSDSKLAFEAASDEVRGEIIGLLYSFCKSHEGRSPAMVGVTRADLGVYAEVLDEEDAENGDDDDLMIVREDSEMTPSKTIDSFATTDISPGSSSLQHSASAPSPGITSAAGKTVLQKRKPPFHQAVAGGGGGGAGDNGVLGGRGSLQLSQAEADLEAAWSVRQDAQLAGLMDAIAGGASSIEDIRSRLADEVSALEGANVHELLESAAAAGVIEEEIGATLGFVDDVEETLQMFDAKLRYMREDMAAIEEWNTRLEMHSKSNLKLVSTLEGVATALTLAPDTESILKSQSPWIAEKPMPSTTTTSNSLERVVAAAWDLHHHHLQILSTEANAAAAAAAASGGGGGGGSRGGYYPVGAPLLSSRRSSFAASATSPVQPHQLKVTFISTQLQEMTAVSGRKRDMQQLAKNFLNRAIEYLEREYSHIADSVLAAIASLSAAERLLRPPPPHSSIHARAAALKPLLEVVTAMRPAAAAPLQAHYCKAVNVVLKKEMSGAVKEILRQAAAASSGGGDDGDADLISMKNVDAIRTLERLQSTPPRNSNSNSNSNSSSTQLQQQGARGHHLRGLSGGGGSSKGRVVEFGKTLGDAFELFISTFFPVLTTEVEKCLEFVVVGVVEQLQQQQQQQSKLKSDDDHLEDELSHAAAAVLSSLLSTIPETILGIVDAVKPPKMLHSLSMMGTVLQWQAKLQRQAAPTAVSELLRQCERKLRTNWTNYINDSVASIQHSDGKSTIGSSSGRSVHVLPFVVNFEAVAGGAEHMVTELIQRERETGAGAGAAGAAMDTSSPLSTSSLTHATPGTVGLMRPSPFETNSSNVDATTVNNMNMKKPPLSPSSFSSPGTSVMLSMLPSPSSAVRAMADALYYPVLEAIHRAVESSAAHDSKHGPRVRLENYSFLRLSLQGLPLTQAPVLQQESNNAAVLLSDALTAYVEQQLEILKLDRLVYLADQLEELAGAGMGPAEAAARLQLTAADTRQAISMAAVGLDKRLLTARQKLHKHLGPSSPYLVEIVWDSVMSRCGQGWEELEQRLPAIFGVGVVGLVPTAEGLRTAFAAAKVGSP